MADFLAKVRNEEKIAQFVDAKGVRSELHANVNGVPEHVSLIHHAVFHKTSENTKFHKFFVLSEIFPCSMQGTDINT